MAGICEPAAQLLKSWLTALFPKLNAGQILQICGYYAGTFSCRYYAGIKSGYNAGISKRAILFPPFLCIENCFFALYKLALPYPFKKQVFFSLFSFTNVFNNQHMIFKRQFLFLEPFCHSF